jgi:hypothetical protein
MAGREASDPAVPRARAARARALALADGSAPGGGADAGAPGGPGGPGGGGGAPGPAAAVELAPLGPPGGAGGGHPYPGGPRPLAEGHERRGGRDVEAGPGPAAPGAGAGGGARPEAAPAPCVDWAQGEEGEEEGSEELEKPWGALSVEELRAARGPAGARCGVVPAAEWRGRPERLHVSAAGGAWRLRRGVPESGARAAFPPIPLPDLPQPHSSRPHPQGCGWAREAALLLWRQLSPHTVTGQEYRVLRWGGLSWGSGLGGEGGPPAGRGRLP